MITLYPDQETFVADIRAAFGRVRRVLAVAPTAFGKTVVFTFIALGVFSRGRRVVIVAHRVEIVDQISKALTRMGVRHGRIQTGHTMTNDLVQVAMVQTLARRLDEVDEPDFFVVDEAHHAVAGTWDRLLKHWKRTRLLGVTATPIRLDGRGLGDAFDEMVIGPRMATLIENRRLSGFDYLAPPQVADFSRIKTRAGDYAIDELADAMDKAVITGDAVSHYRQHLAGRPAIAFCVTVEHAEHVAAQFAAAGIRAASVDGKMEKPKRSRLIASIGDGRLDVLTSCDLISEGTDIPAVSGALLLRPTQSLAMFRQQVGRVLRVKPDGSRAVILDHVGSVHRHGLPDSEPDWSLETRKRREKAPSVRTCETCYRSFAAASARVDATGCKTEACPILMAAPASREIEHQDGELVAINRAEMTELVRLRKTPLSILMRDAHTREDVERIAKARGYKPGWVWRVMEHRAKRRVAA